MNASAGGITVDANGTLALVSEALTGITATTGGFDHKYKVFPLSYVSATEIRVGNGGTGALCVGLAGVDELGDTTGYVTVGEAADYLRFWLPTPHDWADTGTAADLELELYIHEQAGENVDIDVRIFEFNNTTPIVTDTLLITNGAGAAWCNLVTESTGFGDDSDIDGDDSGYYIEVTANTDNDDFNIYGARWRYRVALQATQ